MRIGVHAMPASPCKRESLPPSFGKKRAKCDENRPCPLNLARWCAKLPLPPYQYKRRRRSPTQRAVPRQCHARQTDMMPAPLGPLKWKELTKGSCHPVFVSPSRRKMRGQPRTIVHRKQFSSTGELLKKTTSALAIYIKTVRQRTRVRVADGKASPLVSAPVRAQQ